MKRDLIKKLICCMAITACISSTMPVDVYAATWMNDNMGNYYFYESNKYAVGWRNIDGTVYYFDASGVMQKGWIKYGDSWYYLDNNGALKTGWINYNGEWYYSNSAGIMQTGILLIDGQTYYFGNNGVMKKGNVIINGQFYTIGVNGAIVSNSVPTPDKVFDRNNNCIREINSVDSNTIMTPDGSKYDNPIVDQSEDGDYEEPARKFTVTFRDENGQELKTKSITDGDTVKMYEPDDENGKGDEDRNFIEWNTKRDGSGKSYDSDEKVKVTKDLTLYARWEELEEQTLVSSISITGSNEVEIGKTTQLTAEVKPSDATNTKVKWSIVDNADGTASGKASIDQDGVLTGLENGLGKITVKAEAMDKSNVSTTKVITVVEAKNLIESIKINGPDTISEDGAVVKLTADVSPETASNANVSWKITDGSEYAEIDRDTGELKALADGKVTVMASAKDGSGISATKTINITGQSVKATKIQVSGYENVKTVATGKKLQMVARIYPDNVASANDEVEWSAVYTSGEKIGEQVSINEGTIGVIGDAAGQRLKYAVLNPEYRGKVEVTARSKSDSSILGKTTITVVKDAESVDIKAIDTSGNDITNKPEITTNAGKLNLKALLNPSDTTDTSSVKWSMELIDGDGKDNDVSNYATLTSGETSAIIGAKKNGVIKVTAIANDSSKAIGEITIEFTGQKIYATKIDLYTDIESNGVIKRTEIEEGYEFNIQKGASVTVEGEVGPDNATDKNITWSVLGAKDYVTSKIEGNKLTITANKDLSSEMAAVRIKAVADNIIKEFKINVYENIQGVLVSSPNVVISGQDFKVTSKVLPENVNGDKIKLSAITSANDGSLTGSAFVTSDVIVSRNSATYTVTPVNPGTIKLQAVATLNSSEDSYTTDVITVLKAIENINLESTINQVTLENGQSGNINFTAKVNGEDVGSYSNFLKWEVKSQPKNVTAQISSNGLLSVTRTGDIAIGSQVVVRVSANYDSTKYSEFIIGVSNAPVVDSTATS